MKNTVNALAIFFSFIYLPMAWFMQYLVYSLINATELMWFLFWVNVPFMIISQIISIMVRKVNKD